MVLRTLAEEARLALEQKDKELEEVRRLSGGCAKKAPAKKKAEPKVEIISETESSEEGKSQLAPVGGPSVAASVPVRNRQAQAIETWAAMVAVEGSPLPRRCRPRRHRHLSCAVLARSSSFFFLCLVRAHMVNFSWADPEEDEEESASDDEWMPTAQKRGGGHGRAPGRRGRKSQESAGGDNEEEEAPLLKDKAAPVANASKAKVSFSLDAFRASAWSWMLPSAAD